MTAPAASPRTLHCSFCTKAAPDVAKLIAGPGVYICDECVGLCNGILAAAATDSARDAATDADADSDAAEPSDTTALRHWQNQTDDQILAALPKFTQVSAQVDAGVQELVDLLRERGVAWSRIGAALGVARQSAWEKYSAAE